MIREWARVRMPITVLQLHWSSTKVPLLVSRVDKHISIESVFQRSSYSFVVQKTLLED